MRKFFSILLLLCFFVVFAAAIGLALHLQPRYLIKEIHEISGWCLVVLVFIHIYFHRNVVKAWLIHK